MNMKRLILLFTFTLMAWLAVAQYPFQPQNQQHHIMGTIGEERGSRQRYHYAVDLNTTNGTPVYAIEAGTLQRVKGSVVVGHYAYVHVVNNDMQNYPNGTQIQAGDWIGRVTDGHVHLQQSTTDLTNISGFEEQNNTPWINPIGHLNPVDVVAPDIDEVDLYRQGNNGARITNNPILSGQIDIFVNVEDARINADGTADGFALAPYTMNWEVLDLNNTVLQAYPGISFSNIPTNASAWTVHGPHANHNDPANFEYWITNDAFNTPYDKYWNTLQLQGGAYNASAACPEQTALPEGQRVRIRVNACDFSNNCDQELLPNATSIYIINKFNPF